LTTELVENIDCLANPEIYHVEKYLMFCNGKTVLFN